MPAVKNAAVSMEEVQASLCDAESISFSSIPGGWIGGSYGSFVVINF